MAVSVLMPSTKLIDKCSSSNSTKTFSIGNVTESHSTTEPFRTTDSISIPPQTIPAPIAFISSMPIVVLYVSERLIPLNRQGPSDVSMYSHNATHITRVHSTHETNHLMTEL